MLSRASCGSTAWKPATRNRLTTNVTLFVAGHVRQDSYATETGLLSAEAYADGALVDVALKVITQRKRPRDVPPGAPFDDTFFNRGKSSFLGSSFPSGHATAAFSVATVVAERYKRHRWVPFAAYTLATAVSFSRITSAAHWPSDVFLGAAMGYSVAHFQVLRPQ